MARSVPFLVVLPAALLGCSGDHDAMKKRIAELSDDVTRMQSTQDRLEERLAAVELRSMQATPAHAEKHAPPVSDHPGLRVVRVAPDQPEPPPDEGAGEPDDPAPLPDDDADDGPRPVIRGVGEHFETSTTGGDASNDAEHTAYAAALGLVRGQQYQEATVALDTFLREHPKSPLADNALYWAGECQYALGRYEQAAERFRKLVKSYPSGNKVPDALLKLGMSLSRLGRAEDARASFARLSQNYPDAAAARRIPRGN